MTGEEIKALRLRLGLTQAELGEAIGVFWNTVSRWEAGKMEPSTLALRALAELDRKRSRIQKKQKD
jgi:putative transcriptional regulator